MGVGGTSRPARHREAIHTLPCRTPGITAAGRAYETDADRERDAPGRRNTREQHHGSTPRQAPAPTRFTRQPASGWDRRRAHRPSPAQKAGPPAGNELATRPESPLAGAMDAQRHPRRGMHSAGNMRNHAPPRDDTGSPPPMARNGQTTGKKTTSHPAHHTQEKPQRYGGTDRRPCPFRRTTPAANNRRRT